MSYVTLNGVLCIENADGTVSTRSLCQRVKISGVAEYSLCLKGRGRYAVPFGTVQVARYVWLRCFSGRCHVSVNGGGLTMELRSGDSRIVPLLEVTELVVEHKRKVFLEVVLAGSE